MNGELVQDSNTSQMIFKVPTLVSWVSQYVLPSPLAATQTPLVVLASPWESLGVYSCLWLMALGLHLQRDLDTHLENTSLLGARLVSMCQYNPMLGIHLGLGRPQQVSAPPLRVAPWSALGAGYSKSFSEVPNSSQAAVRAWL